MMTRKAAERLEQEQKTFKMPRDQMAAVAPELATLEYRTSDENFDKNVIEHLGKFANRYGVFGYFNERDRQLYMLRFQKYLDLKAALNGIDDEQLLKEPEAEAILHAQLTMSKDGFTTKELTTQRVYESQGRPREAPGFWGRIGGKIFGRGATPPESEEATP